MSEQIGAAMKSKMGAHARKKNADWWIPRESWLDAQFTTSTAEQSYTRPTLTSIAGVIRDIYRQGISA